jgi:putative oxidoreductase
MTLTSSLQRLAFAPLPAPPGLFALPLRLIIGCGFIEHGYAKLARGPDVFIAILHAMGIPFAFFLGWATIVIEVVGGLLIFAGAFVPLASAPMIVVLLVAIVTVHLPNGFSSIKLFGYDAAGAHFGPPGYETDLLYIAGLLALCFGGAGPLSLDGYVSGRRTADRRNEIEPAQIDVKPPGWPGARPPNPPLSPPSETGRAPPTANRRRG